jgi:raffinose/stachyose/melibiose transport system permease protein
VPMAAYDEARDLPAATGARRSARRRRGGGRNALTCVAFCAPALVLFAVFVAWPVIDTVRLGLYDWDGLDPQRTWIGLDNFRELFTDDEDVRRAIRNTIVWALVTVPLQIGIGLGLALLLDRKLRGRVVFRSIFFLPGVMSSVVIVFGWTWIYNPDIGVINGVFEALGMDGQDWLGDPDAALWASMALQVWRYAGFSMLFYLAALVLIQPSLYEAARVDGASEWQQIRRITLPLLKPMSAVLLLLGLISALREFEVIWILTRGGPAHASELLSTQVFLNAFDEGRLGYASAIATVLLALTFVAAGLALLLVQRAQRTVS